MSEEEPAENVLADIEAERLDSVKKTNETLFKQGKRFSMSNLSTLSDATGAKFEIDGLDLEQDKPKSKKKSKTEPKQPAEDIEERQDDEGNWVDTKNLLDLAAQWDTLKLSQQRALGSLVSLSQSDQTAVESTLATCTAKGVQQFLLKNWSKLFGEQSEISISDLAQAVGQSDRSNKHRAYLIWTMCNYENIREQSQIGNFWETDISRSDIESMVR